MSKQISSNSGVKEIARLAGVSIGTVDRVIHNRTGVSEKTKEKVNGIIRELNYQPNIFASRLASKRKYRIAVMLPHTSKETDFWEAPLQGISRATDEIKNYGVELKYCFFDLSEANSFMRQCKAALKFNPDGILLAPAFSAAATQFMNNCEEKNIPVVLIDSNVSGSNPLSYIGPNMYFSGFQVAHLMAFGNKDLKKILFVEISSASEDAETEQGFRQYFQENGRNPGIIKLNIKNDAFGPVAKSLGAIFKTHPDIEAIFVSNSRVSSVAKFLQREKRTAIMLIGYDILKENIRYLEDKTIDFLICHKPEDQGYRGLMVLVQKLVFNNSPEAVQHMPIDIITRENYRFYRN